MNIPLLSDKNFIKNLKPNTPVYMVEVSWNPKKNENELKVKSLIFVSYSEVQGQKSKNDDVYYGVFKNEQGNIQTEKHNLSYGFYETPKKAIESFMSYVESLSKACKKAMSKEEKRLAKLVQSI